MVAAKFCLFGLKGGDAHYGYVEAGHDDFTFDVGEVREWTRAN